MHDRYCIIEDCELFFHSRGLCRKHYMSARYRGTLENFERTNQKYDNNAAYDPQKTRRLWLRHNYGITPEEFDAQLVRQGGGCALCGTTDPMSRGNFVIDHDHDCCPGRKSCGRCLRGILCNKCNPGIGNLGDNPTLLIKAAQYITNGGVWIREE